MEGMITFAQKQIDRARWDSVRAGETPGSRLARYDAKTKRFQADDGTVVENPDFLVLEDSPLRFYPATVPPEIHNLVRRGYVLRQSFVAYEELPEGTIFNEMDALYLPFAGLAIRGLGRTSSFINDPVGSGGRLNRVRW
jgi:hypothetical protein